MSSFSPMAAVSSHSFAPDVGGQNNDGIYLPRAEYDGLMKIAKYYTNLYGNLINGGINDETIMLLSTQESSTTNPRLEYPRIAPVRRSYHSSSSSSESFTPPTHHQYSHSRPVFRPSEHEVERNSIITSEEATPPAPGSPDQPDSRQEASSEWPPRDASRSILLSNLADGTNHSDITAAVRGGQVLDMFLRRREKTATVSFVFEQDAIAFYEHFRRFDLYIKQKRVLISWQHRQYTLGRHIARKIVQGATRNLIIRNSSHHLTEQIIRDDLEHIHNLIVVGVQIIGGDCCISTNSVSGATTAKACMMSRLRYKDSQIEYGVDECAQTINRIPILKPRNQAPTGNTTSDRRVNRFAVLHVDGSPM